MKQRRQTPKASPRVQKPASRRARGRVVDVEEVLHRRAAQVDRELGRSVGRVKDHPALGAVVPPRRLLAAMGYSLLAGGKRLRPVLCLEACAACGGLPWQAMPAACALEMVHTYSLIHDDLPAMDNDDFRRGQPTVHKAFDEATAVLAGDGLLTDAFGVVARARHNALEQVRELALAAGSCGMAGGQVMDMEAEGKDPREVDLPGIHRRKTGRMFVAAAVMGGLSANASPRQLTALRAYGAALGLAFQVADDILDVTDVKGKGGKGAGRDVKHKKATYVALHGLEGARKRAREAVEDAVAALKPLGKKGVVLEALARFAGERDR